MPTCPACASPLQRLIGCDGYEVEPAMDGSSRARKLDAVYACARCEHVEKGKPVAS